MQSFYLPLFYVLFFVLVFISSLFERATTHCTEVKENQVK